MTGNKTETKSQWFKSWFDTSFYFKLYSKRNDSEAAAFIDSLIDELQPGAGSQMLDLGCGNGRHSKYLASKGFTVMGIDLAASSIREAKKSETDTLKFRRQDMRNNFGVNAFDYIFNFFTSFGYFDDVADDHKVIRNVSDALKPGGVFVMDYINAVYAEKNLIPSEEKEIDGIIYHISRWSDAKHIYKKIIVDDGSENKPEFNEQVKKITVDDFVDMFSYHGLEVTAVFGNYSLEEYNRETSPRLILIAKKTA